LIKLILIYLFFNLILFQTANLVSKTFSSSKNDSSEKKVIVYAKGLINNPEVFYQASILHQNSNKLDNAIADIELAIGLLEMHKSSEKYEQKFKTRLQELQELKKAK